MKTAEEILNEYMPKESGHFSKKCVLKAMQTYADQFKNNEMVMVDFDYAMEAQLNRYNAEAKYRGDRQIDKHEWVELKVSDRI